MPLPYPHRATFLATTLVVPASLERLCPYLARLISVIVFDHLVRHPIITLGDDDERLVADDGRLLDAQHPQAEDTIDWLFRLSRRHEVLWLQVSLDAARPAPAVLHARRPSATVAPSASQPPALLVDAWTASPEVALSHQLSQCLAQWLAARRLPAVGALGEFSLDDLRSAAGRLANADAVLSQRAGVASVPPSLTQPPARLAVAYLRVLAELSRDATRTFDPLILAVDPSHPVARRNHYVSGLLRGDTERREILPLVDEAPMYGKPHLSIWGEPFAADRPLENMGVRHQGIAASLMPANAYACHNYSLQLADVQRREESYRWADRATVAAPQFGAAHLDCVRRLRQVGRPGQAFAEAQYRCREILDRAAAGKLPAADWQAPHHAALLIAFAHLDVGRIAEAIELADDALARVPDDAATREAFAWASKRISHWKTDAGLLARAFAWEGYHRGDPGRTIAGLTRGRISDDDDAAMLIDSLIAIGREDQARVAYAHCAGLDGTGLLGDGRARLAAARALIISGELDEALDQIQIVELRRSQSRFDAELNRLLRLAATRPAGEWERVVERRLDRGALRLARMAARDLADFVPGLADSAVIVRALGLADQPEVVVDDAWFAELVAALPAATATSAAILARLEWPADDSLRAADTLAQEWWSVLVPPARDRDAHAAGAMLALGVALAHYLAAATRAPTPLAGGYRHIATEALHLVRRSRYQIDPSQIRALLALIERLAGVPEPLLDGWLLRVERALDLEAEHGSYLDGLTDGLPVVKRLLRGDERTGWELRLAHDLGRDPSQYEPAAMLFDRCARAVEGGTVPAAWSAVAGAAAPPQAQLDVHWLAAYANPTVAAPWLRVAHGLLATGRVKDGLAAAMRGMTVATAGERAAAFAELAPRWRAAGIATPLHGETAFEAGLSAASEDRLDVAIQHLRWAVAVEPGNAKRAQSLAVALAKAGSFHDAVRVLAAHERTDAPRLIGRVLLDAGRAVDAVAVLRYAARRFRTAEDWALLAQAGRRADNDAVVVDAGRRAVQLGARDHELLVSLATSLYRLGEFVDCETVAHQLILDRAIPRDAKVAGLHAMARALAGQGRHVDAHPYAKGAGELGPNGELAADLIETMDRIVAQQTPPVRASSEATMERRAFADLELAQFDTLESAIASPSWAVTRAALCACEFRRDDESGIPVAPRALEAAVIVLDRTRGAAGYDAVLARIRALRIRDNAFIQIDPPPPLGLRFTLAEFEKLFADRNRRPARPSAIYSAVR